MKKIILALLIASSLNSYSFANDDVVVEQGEQKEDIAENGDEQ